MRPDRRIILALIITCAVSARCALSAHAADSAGPHHAAGVGAVRKNEIISLAKSKAGYTSGGLWAEHFRLPKAVRVKTIRLVSPRIPPGRCDVITQVRLKLAKGDWSAWTPVNILPNADFENGAPRGARLLVKAGGDKEDRVASAPLPKTGGAALFWSAVATPGANATFTTDVISGAGGGRTGVGARFGAGPGVLAAQVLATMPQVPGTHARRMTVGLSVPPAARTFEGLALLTSRAPGGAPKIEVRRGMLRLEPTLPVIGLVAHDDFSNPGRWQVARDAKAEWVKAKPAALSLTTGANGAPAAAFHAKPAAFRHHGWLEARATVTLKNAQAAANVLLYDAQGKQLPVHLSVRASGRDGVYRFWGRGPIPKEATRLRVLLQAAPVGRAAGTVTFHRVQVRACDPPVEFSRRPPPKAVGFPKAVLADQVQIRSFLLTASRTHTPSFKGYEIDFE
jgi:hypothetical protein